MQHILSLLFITLVAIASSAKSKIEVEIELLTSDIIGEVVIDKTPFFDWVKVLKTDIESVMRKEKGDKDLVVIVTIHANKSASISMGSRPAIKETNFKTLEKVLNSHKSPRTKFNEYSFMFLVKINDGCGCENDFTPALVFPGDRRMNEFNALSLIEKKADIQTWMKNDVLPLLASYESNVDTLYLGVLNLGKSIQDQSYSRKDVKDLTDFNPNYWRATMEMNVGNQLIPFTKICLLLANGEFDHANRLLYVVSFFYDEKTLPVLLDRELNAKLQSYFNALEEEIKVGIALHDQEKYSEAIAHYDDLLINFPNSAWLNYEKYFSTSALTGNIDVSGNEWKEAQKTIYECDPMYPINAQAKSGKEGFLLFRRQEINELFTSAESVREDIIRYADIALDIENYAYAAQVYWLIYSHLDKVDYGGRNMFAHYLYCLDKLGDTVTIQNFKEDYTAEFEKIKAERNELMKESSIFKAFKTEE